MLAMYHDYRIQNPIKGFLCLNEVLFGAVLASPMTSIFREKLPSYATFRSLILEGKRFPAKEALKEGIVDALGGLDEVMEFARQRELVKMGNSGVYSALKEEMYMQSLGMLESYEENLKWRRKVEGQKEKEKKDGRGKVLAWENSNGKAKL